MMSCVNVVLRKKKAADFGAIRQASPRLRIDRTIVS